jgi:hypothetical protein
MPDTGDRKQSDRHRYKYQGCSGNPIPDRKRISYHHVLEIEEV